MSRLLFTGLLTVVVVWPAPATSKPRVALIEVSRTESGYGTTSQSSVIGTRKIMIFGGDGHDVYLGCLSCSRYDSDSVFNKYGTFGSRYSPNSILNPYSEFGSKYSNTSACNPYASDPPVIVDDQGNYYGRLTMNRYLRDGPPIAELDAWLTAVCLA